MKRCSIRRPKSRARRASAPQRSGPARLRRTVVRPRGQGSFGQRRKMLRNSLRAAFGDFGGVEHPFFTQRAEQLSVADFVELTRWVEEHIYPND